MFMTQSNKLGVLSWFLILQSVQTGNQRFREGGTWPDDISVRWGLPWDRSELTSLFHSSWRRRSLIEDGFDSRNIHNDGSYRLGIGLYNSISCFKVEVVLCVHVPSLCLYFWINIPSSHRPSKSVGVRKVLVVYHEKFLYLRFVVNDFPTSDELWRTRLLMTNLLFVSPTRRPCFCSLLRYVSSRFSIQKLTIPS